MKKLVGILPASGKATRIGGIPKFCLPVGPDLTLIQWHINQMNEVCDEVRVSTRSTWIPLLKEMKIQATLIEIEPSTMSDAVYKMAKNGEQLIIGMPDTYIHGSKSNIYMELLDQDADIVLGIWQCEDYLKGKVGQVLMDLDTGRVTSSIDKVIECRYEHMWGIIRFNLDRAVINRELNHPGEQFQSLIDENVQIKGKVIPGKYFDVGNFSILKEMYSIL